MPPENVGEIQRTYAAANTLLQQLAHDARVTAAVPPWMGAMLGAHPSGGPEIVIRLVRDDLQVPPSFAWLPPALHVTFALWARDLTRDDPRHIPSFSIDATGAVQLGMKRGRGPRGTIERDVEWYYRARVKHPRDPVRAIMRGARLDDPRLTSEPSLVRGAIQRVEKWLAADFFSWADALAIAPYLKIDRDSPRVT